MELIRDSQLSVWGGDLTADDSENCSYENISCTLTTYNGSDGSPLVKTMLYAGVNAKSATYGKGHYWSGDDEYQDKWAKEQGPSASQAVWAFFENITMDGVYQPACENDSSAPATPIGLSVLNIHDKHAELSVNANSEEDFKGYKIYTTDGISLTSSPVATQTITISGLSPETEYQINATAVDQCGNESPASASIAFTTTTLEYIASTASGTCTEHYNAGRLDINGYLACGSANGYIADVTLWQKQDGSWTTEDLNNGSSGGDTGSGGTGGTPGSWSTNPNLAGMEVHLYTPTSTSSNGKRALMIALHGCAQSNEIVRDNWSWDDEADEYGMVIAAPMAPSGGVIAGCWDYYDSTHSASNPSRHDGNLINLANTLSADNNLNIDVDQVYITGLSSGGGETFVMGCLAPEIFAGIGINAGPAVGTSSGQIGSVAVTASQARNTCLSFADNNNQSAFQSQITSVVHGNSDSTVAKGYADIDAETMALIYGTAKDNVSSTVTGGGAKETWSDSEGTRIEKIMVTGLGHAWPAGNDSSGGSYTDHGTIDYPAQVTQFFFANNRRADFTNTEDVTPPNVPTNLAKTSSTAASITLAWNAVADADLANYSIYQNGNFYANTNNTSITVIGLLAETSYSFSVSATDTTGNESSLSGALTATTQAAGTNEDTITPVITLVGSSNISLTAGENYTDAGATATDNVDGDITANIMVSGSVDTSIAGTYILSFNVVDAAGNAADTVMRTVVVNAASICTATTASNYAHVQAGRATTNNIYAYAVGSGENMGLYNLFYTTTLAETSSGYFEVGDCQ
jgi:poly(3-hydroxybutyrate) depolymerase